MNDQPVCRICGKNHLTGACVGDARVSIPAIKSPDAQPEVIDDEISRPVKFFDVPQNPNMQPLDDDEKTPVVPVKSIVPKDTVTELSLADIHAGMRGHEVAKASVRGNEHKAHVERINERELEHVFDDVAKNRDSEVVSFIKRGITDQKFENIGQVESFIKELFGGDNDPAGVWNPEDLKPYSKMVVELRIQIGNDRPVVEVYLVNEAGQGVRKGKDVTRVYEVKIQKATKVSDLKAEEQKLKPDSGLWKKATGWFTMTRKKPEDK